MWMLDVPYDEPWKWMAGRCCYRKLINSSLCQAPTSNPWQPSLLVKALRVVWAWKLSDRSFAFRNVNHFTSFCRFGAVQLEPVQIDLRERLEAKMRLSRFMIPPYSTLFHHFPPFPKSHLNGKLFSACLWPRSQVYTWAVEIQPSSGGLVFPGPVLTHNDAIMFLSGWGRVTHPNGWWICRSNRNIPVMWS